MRINIDTKRHKNSGDYSASCHKNNSVWQVVRKAYDK